MGAGNGGKHIQKATTEGLAPPNPDPDTPGTQSTQNCTKTVKRQAQQVAAAASPRRPRSPLPTGARARSPTDSARQHGQKNQAHPLARLDEDAIIDPNFMVVLEVEAENDDKDGRVEACGACEAVLA